MITGDQKRVDELLPRIQTPTEAVLEKFWAANFEKSKAGPSPSPTSSHFDVWSVVPFTE